MLKIVVAEDDPAMRLVLKKVLNGISGVEVTAEAENGKQLVQKVEELKPDAVFLDIDMPEMTGVEAAREIFDINPKIFIIFATAFDNYTHEAFQVYAFDYLIKPFNLDRIRQTMERIKELQAEREKTGSVERQVMQLGKDNQKLLIQTNDSQKFINVQDIIILTRNDRQTVIYTLHGIIKTYESLQKIGERLNVSNFFRCHKGFIINADMVSEIFPWGNRSYLVKMLNTKETALMTVEKVKEFRDRYCLN